MSKKVVTQIETVVNYMTDPDMSDGFVSLVSRGANQTPFLVVKSDKTEEEDGMSKILQSVLVPKDVDMAVVKAMLGDDVSLSDGIETGKYKVFEQVAKGECEDGSFGLVTLSEEHGIRGVVAKHAGSGNIVTKLFKPKTPVLKLADGINEQSDEDVLKSVSYETYDELYAMYSGISAALAQTVSSADVKKEMIQKFLDNFVAYIDEAVKVTADKFAQPIVKEEEQKEDEEDDPVETTEKGETKEEKPEVEKGEDEEVEETKGEDEDGLDGVKKMIEEMKDNLQKSLEEALKPVQDTVKGLSKTVEKMQTQIPTPVDLSDSDDQVPASKNDQDDKKQTFKGVLFSV